MSRSDKVGKTATKVFIDESDNSFNVKYHNTIVWKRRADGVIVLNSGGWRTVTTKARMNQAFNQYEGGAYQVYQEKGEWFVQRLPHGSAQPMPFDDHMVINPSWKSES